jgi:hypothetical protein
MRFTGALAWSLIFTVACVLFLAFGQGIAGWIVSQ